MTLSWFKSSRSGTDPKSDCLEAEYRPTVVAIRDSMNPDDGELQFTHSQWSELVQLLCDSDERDKWPIKIDAPGDGGDKAAARPLLDFARAEWRGASPIDDGRVEYAFLPHAGAHYVGVRHSATPGFALLFDEGEWAAFVCGAIDGEFSLVPA